MSVTPSRASSQTARDRQPPAIARCAKPTRFPKSRNHANRLRMQEKKLKTTKQWPRRGLYDCCFWFFCLRPCACWCGCGTLGCVWVSHNALLQDAVCLWLFGMKPRWESRHYGYGNPASSLCHLIYVTTEGVPHDMAVAFDMNEKYFYKTLDKDTVRWLNSCPK